MTTPNNQPPTPVRDAVLDDPDRSLVQCPPSNEDWPTHVVQAIDSLDAQGAAAGGGEMSKKIKGETPEQKRKREWAEADRQAAFEKWKAEQIARFRGDVTPPPLPRMSNT